MIPARTAVTMVTANTNLQTCAIRFTFGRSVRVSAGRLSGLAFGDEPRPKAGLGACVSNVMFELRLLPDGAASLDLLTMAYEFEMGGTGSSYERYKERSCEAGEVIQTAIAVLTQAIDDAKPGNGIICLRRKIIMRRL
jgi:hypothetical protein